MSAQQVPARRHHHRRQRRRLRGAADRRQPMERREPVRRCKTTSLLWPGIVELNSALSAGTPPDIVSLHAFRVPAYASKGAFWWTSPRTSPRRASTSTTCWPKPPRGRDLQRQDLAVPIDLHGALWHVNPDLWAEGRGASSMRMASRCLPSPASPTSRRPAKRMQGCGRRRDLRLGRRSCRRHRLGVGRPIRAIRRKGLRHRGCASVDTLRPSRRFRPC